MLGHESWILGEGPMSEPLEKLDSGCILLVAWGSEQWPGSVVRCSARVPECSLAALSP
jgi:hypothetical protein